MSTQGGPGTSDPTRFTCRGCPLALLIAKASDVDLYQVAGPDWLLEDLYEVAAVIPEKTSIAQFQQMLQSLLADRFGLKTQKENREVSGYELSAGPKISKLTVATAPHIDPPDDRPPLKDRLDAHGFPTLVPGETIAMMLGRNRRHTQETMREFIAWLTLWLGKPVVDRTALTGRYDITLSFVMESAAQDIPGPTLVDAVRETGLRLVSKKVQVDYIVVKSALRIPADN
jgi:uncharacterized protein (TIGR03435 family)